MRTTTRELPPVWIVSLRKSDRRRAAIAARLSSLGLPFEFVDAVDGKAMAPRDLLASCHAGETMRLECLEKLKDARAVYERAAEAANLAPRYLRQVAWKWGDGGERGG